MPRSSNSKERSISTNQRLVKYGRISNRTTGVFIRLWVSIEDRSCVASVCSLLEEEKQRLHVFRDHLRYVLEMNLERLRTYQLELNEFADWTLQEFSEWKKGLLISSRRRRRHIDHQQDDDQSVRRSLTKLYQHRSYLRRLARRQRKYSSKKRFFRDWLSNLFHHNRKPSQGTDLFDWRTKNVVSSVKNQLKCGCCYAFSTASILETLYALKRNASNVIEFSAQQMTDCSGEGNNGCQGGNFPPSIRYISGRGNKIATASSYPYAGKRQACRNNGLEEVDLGPIEYHSISEGDEKAMADALVNHGPLFIGVDAESRRFMFYKSGVLKIDHCPTRRQDMDHAMVIVGHGHDSALQASYWIIRNSWGTRWGENGYLRLAKDAGNMCGVASMAHYAKLT